MDRLRLEGFAYLAGFIACVPAANWLIGNVGTVCIPQGPCLIPVAPFGITAPSGVLMIGLALVLRDLVQRRLGKGWALAAILAGAALSGFVAPPALVIASTVAFLLSELADLRCLYAAAEARPDPRGGSLQRDRSCRRLGRVPLSGLWQPRLSGRPDHRQGLDGAAQYPGDPPAA